MNIMNCVGDKGLENKVEEYDKVEEDDEDKEKKKKKKDE